MKNIYLLIGFLVTVNLATGQEKITIPEISPEHKTEVLYNHVYAYLTTGITFARTKGVSPLEYGKYIGQQFTPFWNPEQGFQVFAIGMMDILKSLHPDNEMQIISQNDKMIRFKMKNVDYLFKKGPFLGVTFDEILECSYGIISVLADHMNVKFSHNFTEDLWYEVTLEKK